MATGAVGGGDLRGLHEDLGDLRVHVDDLVTFDGHLLVASIDSFINPLREGITNDGVYQVAYVLPVQLETLLWNRKSFDHQLLLSSKLQDGFDLEPLIVGYSDTSDLGLIDAHLLVSHQVTKMCHGNGLKRRNEDLAFIGEEAMDFTFAPVLGSEEADIDSLWLTLIPRYGVRL